MTVGLRKEIFARTHSATHKPTSAQRLIVTTMTHTHTHTHTHTRTHTHEKSARRGGAPQASCDRRRHRNCFQTRPLQTTRMHIHMHDINSIHSCSMLASACITSTAITLVNLLVPSTTANQPALHSFLSSHSHTTTHFLHWLRLVLFSLSLHSLHLTFIAVTK